MDARKQIESVHSPTRIDDKNLYSDTYNINIHRTDEYSAIKYNIMHEYIE